MGREIKFRGKRLDDTIHNGRWVYGHYFIAPLTDENSGMPAESGWFFLSGGERRHCIEQNGVVYTVDSETVGQFTGQHDKNDVAIYEGDIVRGAFTIDKRSWPTYESNIDTSTNPKFIVEFRNGGFMLNSIYDDHDYFPKTYVGLDEFSWFPYPLGDGTTHEHTEYKHDIGLRTHTTLKGLEVIGSVH